MGSLRVGAYRCLGVVGLAVILSLAACRGPAMVGEQADASPSGSCAYDPSTDTINIRIDPGAGVAVAVEDDANADLDAEASTGAILFSPIDPPSDYEDGRNSTACGSATISNTVTIVVLGQPSLDEIFLIDERNGGRFPTSIAWAVDLGTEALLGDSFMWIGSDDDGGSGLMNDDRVVVTDSSFDINGAIGELVGIESFTLIGGDGDDILDASALTKYLNAAGGDGDDWIAPGRFNGDDVFGDLGAGTPFGTADHLSYGGRTTCTVIDSLSGRAGEDANCDGDLADAGDEVDAHGSFEILESGSGNDTLIGDPGTETFVPGEGDDEIVGGPGSDRID